MNTLLFGEYEIVLNYIIFLDFLKLSLCCQEYKNCK